MPSRASRPAGRAQIGSQSALAQARPPAAATVAAVSALFLRPAVQFHAGGAALSPNPPPAPARCGSHYRATDMACRPGKIILAERHWASGSRHCDVAGNPSVAEVLLLISPGGRIAQVLRNRPRDVLADEGRASFQAMWRSTSATARMIKDGLREGPIRPRADQALVGQRPGPCRRAWVEEMAHISTPYARTAGPVAGSAPP